MKSTKKGLFKKLGAGLLVMAAMAPLALGMTSVKSVSAAETDDKVTVSLHKMIRGKDAKDITNTGAELDNLDDYTNWNREDDGDVAFSIYSVDAAFDAWKKKSTTPSYEDDGKAFNAFQQYILNFDGEQDELLADLGVSAPIQTIDSRTSEINDNLFNFTNITNNGKYMILETYIDTDHTTSKAIPTVFSLPLAAATGKTVHLYAKNTVPKTDPELEKKMEDKDQPGEFELKENIEFTLTKDGSTNFEPVEASTDENGILKIKNLSAGNYTLTETEVDGYTPAVIKFKVSQGNISITSSTPDDVTVNQVNGVWTFSVKTI
ncbi:pilin N-terminal domain-containing protein [Pediococcus parvulus]|uniref:pilin N-terminal domain-containing protein n=1 Tax=Pediococcus parvulus TaxID=54062 RepID=UPI00345E3999